VVTGIYRLVLGRDPDPSGLDNYSGRLASGADVGEVIAQMALTEEFQALEAARSAPSQALSPVAAAILVRLAYALVLRRPADEEGLEHLVNTLVEGGTLPDVIRALTDSEEMADKLQEPGFWEGLDLLADTAALLGRVSEMELKLAKVAARQLDTEALNRRLAVLEDVVAAMGAPSAPAVTGKPATPGGSR
jgi:hypothetical protein